MEHFVTAYGGWIGIVSAGIFGILAIISKFDERSQKMRKTETDTADNVIGLLQNEVTELTKKVTKQDGDIQALTVTVNNLKAENKTLLDKIQPEVDKKADELKSQKEKLDVIEAQPIKK